LKKLKGVEEVEADEGSPDTVSTPSTAFLCFHIFSSDLSGSLGSPFRIDPIGGMP
jgi:hypothetical protein